MGSLLRRVVLYLRIPAGMIALAGLLLSILVQTASIRGVDVESAWPSVWTLHYALFPIVVLAALTGSVAAKQKRLSWRGFLGLVPVPALVLLTTALLYVIATFVMVMPLSGAGDPVITDGHFYFNDHGIMRQVSEDQFHLQRGLSLRLYSNFWIYLYLFAVVYLFGVRLPPDEQHSSATDGSSPNRS